MACRRSGVQFSLAPQKSRADHPNGWSALGRCVPWATPNANRPLRRPRTAGEGRLRVFPCRRFSVPERACRGSGRAPEGSGTAPSAGAPIPRCAGPAPGSGAPRAAPSPPRTAAPAPEPPSGSRPRRAGTPREGGPRTARGPGTASSRRRSSDGSGRSCPRPRRPGCPSGPRRPRKGQHAGHGPPAAVAEGVQRDVLRERLQRRLQEHRRTVRVRTGPAPFHVLRDLPDRLQRGRAAAAQDVLQTSRGSREPQVAGAALVGALLRQPLGHHQRLAERAGVLTDRQDRPAPSEPPTASSEFRETIASFTVAASIHLPW